jgi:hypothetical protein
VADQLRRVIDLQIGRRRDGPRWVPMRFNVDEVWDVVHGYAFDSVSVAARPPSGPPFGSFPTGLEHPRYAYRSYDCVTSDDGPLTMNDVLLTAGLNSRISATVAARIMAIAPELDEALRQIPPETRFWDLDPAQLASPTEGTTSWWLHRAWWLLMNLAGVKISTTHKVLHHKRPAVFPLIDRQTQEFLGEWPWRTIHCDLNDTDEARSEFQRLEDRFAAEAGDRGGAPLTRLRIHDIVLWCHAADRIQPVIVRHE